MPHFIDLSNDSTSSSSDAENDRVNIHCRKTPLKRSQPSENVENMELTHGKNVNILRRTKQLNNERKQIITIISEQNSESAENCKASLWRQVHMLKLKIGSLEKEIQKHQSDKEHNQAVWLCKKQKLKIQELQKINQEWELNYKKLEKKYDELSKEKARARQISKIVQLDNACYQEDKKYEDIFNIDFKADTDEPFPVEEENDMDVDEVINYEVELSEKDFEIRKHKKYLNDLEERFKIKDQSERVTKRKLKDMESEKELATKRLKAVEEEKEKLVDELESTTLCGFCEENPKDIVFDPCGHIWACEKCVSFAKMTNCPTCREAITNVRKVFIA